METENNNRLIAEFMGIEEAYNPNGNDWVLKTTTPDKNGDTDILESFKGNELQYHTDWNWLMPVVSKILTNENFIGYRLRENIIDSLPYGMIDDTYDAVVEFIKWHNENLKRSKFICGVCGEHVNEYTYNEETDVDECNECKTKNN
jgi:hypothetical protein